MRPSSLRRIIACALIPLVFFMSGVDAYPLFSGESGPFGCDIELDPYYTSAEWYAGLGGQGRPYLEEMNEGRLYRDLLKRSFLPGFLLFEVSCYPMPWLGVEIKRSHREFYDRMQIEDNVNVVRALTSGFEEPAAVSVFLGNLVSFRPKGNRTEQQGKAYMGYLLSAGTQHIKDCELLEDRWLEFEWKVKGERLTEERRMKWSFRAGTKQHEHPDIKDVVYVSLKRDEIDYCGRSLMSLIDNGSIEYIMDFDYRELHPIRHYILLGKSCPFLRKLTLQLHYGFMWEGSDKYTGALRRRDDGGRVTFMVRPNIVF